MPYQTYPYELPPLPYAYNALEPYIDEETMHYHHDKHFKTYIDNLNRALEPYPALQKHTLEQLIGYEQSLPREAATAIMNNAGGVYNHMLFFEGLSPANSGRQEPDSALMTMIEDTFSSFDNFKKTFSQQALSVFGSGWVCLAQTAQKKLVILSLANQATVISHGATPLLLLDVWEHAYYLKYRNVRANYIEEAWNVLSFLDRK